MRLPRNPFAPRFLTLADYLARDPRIRRPRRQLRRLPLLLLLVVTALAAAPPTWRYLPFNTERAGKVTSGLAFTVEPPGPFQVSVTTQEGNRPPVVTTQDLEMDPNRAGGVLYLRIDNLDHFHVLRITITVDGKTLTYTDPAAGKRYSM